MINRPTGQGRRVTVDTVTCWLVYEIQGPIYPRPDVATDLCAVQFERVAANRVRGHGARSLPPLAPTRPTKPALSADIRWRLENRVFVTGRAVDAGRQQQRGPLGARCGSPALDSAMPEPRDPEPVAAGIAQPHGRAA